MSRKILLTSFDTWEPHQKSNSSDDLIAAILQREQLPDNLYFLRKLPVDFQLAPEKTIAHINQLKPDIIICCGMAESRKTLSIESNAKAEDKVLTPSIDIARLIAGLSVTEISHDAGKFVCNSLYYSVLKLIHEMKLNSQCLFIHVPILTEANLEQVVREFLLILQRLPDLK